MRKIKFRAWDIVNNKMLNNNDLWDIPYNEIFIHTPDQRALNIMEYCNFKDCNDKEVYEGDILEFEWIEPSCWGDEGTYKGYIEFKEGGFEVIYIDRQEITKCENGGQHVNNMSDNLLEFVRWTQPINIKVIGNIYENQELLD